MPLPTIEVPQHIEEFEVYVEMTYRRTVKGRLLIKAQNEQAARDYLDSCWEENVTEFLLVDDEEEELDDWEYELADKEESDDE